MASEGFYVFMGIIAFIILAFGGIGLQGNYSIPWAPFSGYIILVGIVFVAIIGVGAYRDIKSRVKDWNAEHKYDELEQRETELALKEREMEIRAREERLKKESEAQRKKQTPTQTESPQTESVQTEHATSEIKLDDRYFQDSFNDEPILKTGDHSFNISKKVKKSTEHKISTKLNPDSQYITSVTSNNSRLKFLWYIYLHGGYFKNQTDASRIIFGDVSQRKKMGLVFKEFEEFGLITSKITRSLADEKPEKEFWLTNFGKKMMEIAINENISDFEVLAEKYDLEQKKTNQELESCSFESVNVQKVSDKNISDPSTKQELEDLFANLMHHGENNDFRKAIEYADKILEIVPDDLFVLLLKGAAHADLNEDVEAEACLDRMLEIDPNDPNALTGKAQLNTKKNPELAMKLFQKSLSIEETFDNHIGLAIRYDHLFQYETALNHVKKAFEFVDDESSLDRLTKLQKIIEENFKNWSKRSSADRQVMLLQHSNPRGNEIKSLLDTARQYYKTGDNQKIIELMDKVLEIVPECAFALGNKAWALLQLEQYIKAERCVDLALQYVPDDDYVLKLKKKIQKSKK